MPQIGFNDHREQFFKLIPPGYDYNIRKYYNSEKPVQTTKFRNYPDKVR